MSRMFRLLNADEIECRVSTVSEKGCSILLYKDARCDQNILDETVGQMNWQRRHSRDNANCEVGIWDAEKAQWVWKEDTGTESYTEKEKGLASDSFKRACFNWGIGRELYTAPFIWIKSGDVELVPGKNGKLTTYDRFDVAEIGYDDAGRINKLVIKKKNKAVYTLGKKQKDAPQSDKQADDDSANDKISEKELAIVNKTLTDNQAAWVLDKLKLGDLSELTKSQYAWLFQQLNKQQEAKNGKQSKTA